MRIVIDPMLCDGHALCEAIAPDVFVMGPDEKAHVSGVEIGADLLEAVREAAMMCPCQAISLGEDHRAQGEESER
jgi:ferredoxin